MSYPRWTERAQRIILIAQEEAKSLNHDYVGTEHILLGLLALGEGVGFMIIEDLRINPKDIKDSIVKIVGTGNNIMLLGEIPFTPRAKKVLELSVEEAEHLGMQHVGTEHVLLGLIKESEGVAAQVLESLGATYIRVRKIATKLLQEESPRPNKKLLAAAKAYAESFRGVTITVNAPNVPQLILTEVKHYSFVRSMILVEMKDKTEYYVPQAYTIIHDSRTHAQRYK